MTDASIPVLTTLRSGLSTYICLNILSFVSHFVFVNSSLEVAFGVTATLNVEYSDTAALNLNQMVLWQCSGILLFAGRMSAAYQCNSRYSR
jgi:hypothetical protein